MPFTASITVTFVMTEVAKVSRATNHRRVVISTRIGILMINGCLSLIIGAVFLLTSDQQENIRSMFPCCSRPVPNDLSNEVTEVPISFSLMNGNIAHVFFAINK